MADIVLGKFLRRLKHRRRIAVARADLAARLKLEDAVVPHGLPEPLVVSLTSYPPRFGTLANTLVGLLTQNVRPDNTILWLASKDIDRLPREVTQLSELGLEIAATTDLRSYNKLIPTLAAWPEATIVTADDDVYYPRTWLQQMIAAKIAGGAGVICHRAHRIVTNAAGGPAPYPDWTHNIAVPETGRLVFPTGVSGVLYGPGTLAAEALRADLFEHLCDGADDVWFYWMHRLAGGRAQKIGGRTRIIEWAGSQGVALRTKNIAGCGNNRAIAAMVARYGFPP